MVIVTQNDSHGVVVVKYFEHLIMLIDHDLWIFEYMDVSFVFG